MGNSSGSCGEKGGGVRTDSADEPMLLVLLLAVTPLLLDGASPAVDGGDTASSEGCCFGRGCASVESTGLMGTAGKTQKSSVNSCSSSPDTLSACSFDQ